MSPPYPYLTEEEIQFLEEDRQRVIDETNAAFHTTKTKIKIKTGAVARAVKKSKIQEIKDRDLFLSFIHRRLAAADPKHRYADMAEGVTHDYEPELPSTEELAIRMGIIKVHRPTETEKEKKEVDQ